MTSDYRWQAMQSRNPNYDGEFVYAVRTTGIYCRPTCPARKPKRENVEFFAACHLAERAGYRPCKRCHPHEVPADHPQMELVVRVCRYLEQSHMSLPTLNQLSERFHLSADHLQRIFTVTVGVSPRQYADAYRQGRLRGLLRERATVTEAVYAAGYTSNSQVYSQTDDILGMTPTRYRDGAPDTAIHYVVVACDLGYLAVATTEHGVCHISLGDDPDALRNTIAEGFPAAVLSPDDTGLAEAVALITAYIDGDQTEVNLPLDIQATAFQRQVWEALRRIPYGATRTYAELAEMIGRPSAARAVANACGKNPVALTIPCHRIVRADGSMGGYRWGLERKAALLARESAQSQPSEI